MLYNWLLHIVSVVVLTCSPFGRYVDRIANAKWEVKELGLEHNGYPFFFTIFFSETNWVYNVLMNLLTLPPLNKST